MKAQTKRRIWIPVSNIGMTPQQEAKYSCALHTGIIRESFEMIQLTSLPIVST
ncbi:hypothetical protein [Wolbachia endosymbiont (group B) of Apotomis betuletana]|uniref:hypothetical protein n=1 Tax=Wolbachia endosymbiont (group B) of Apotomis betuletana TaxID=2953982 RepID=UPI002227B424|nr:hypothetical protein [Wolbachia endosymbiont (group B) of Apotomis betuletana]